MPVTLHYQVQYEVCALVFLLVVAARFFSIRRFPNRTNRLFGVILICAIADLSLDIVGAYTIMDAASVAPWVNYAVNTAFYALQIVFPALMMTYVLFCAGYNCRQEPCLQLLLLPAAVFLLLLLANFFDGCIFFVRTADGVNAYCRGSLFPLLYLGTAFYLVATVALVFFCRARLAALQRRTILAFILVVVAAVLIQYLFPELLLTGAAIAVAILMMFFTLQNPDEMLDAVSGTFNYNALMTYVDGTIARREPLRFLVADVGGIRRVNSDFGLLAGNEVLSLVGAFFQSLHPHAWVFRLMGTRFFLTVPEDADLRRLVTLLRARFEQSWTAAERELSLSVTVRFFDTPEVFGTPEELLRLIDEAYADVGADGWGRCRRISGDTLAASRRKAQIETALRAALQPGGEGLSLHYQPILDRKSGLFSCAEALLRLRAPELGDISPAEFIPIAEKSGLILRIDEFVLRAACAFLARNPEPERLEVNLSAAEFFRNPLDDITAIVSESGVDPMRLCFEVTETAATAHPDILSDFMTAMNRRGFCFALDDFGTGYANITQVCSLPFSIAKLDKIFLADDARTRALFDAMVDMFGRIGVFTVAEGVETRGQALRVEPRADYLQGFLYAQPMPEAEFTEFLKQQSRAAGAARR